MRGRLLNSGKGFWLVTLIAVVVILGGVFLYRAKGPSAPVLKVTQDRQASSPLASATQPAAPPAKGPATIQAGRLAGTLKVAVPSLGTDGRFPLEYSCYRKNLTPALRWQGVPKGTKSLMVVLERRLEGKAPDWTWVLFNIDSAAGVAEGLPPQDKIVGTMRYGQNSYGNSAYIGPCEPKGKVNYAIRLFALDTMLDLPAGASRDAIIQATNGHVLDMTEAKVVHYLSL